MFSAWANLVASSVEVHTYEFQCVKIILPGKIQLLFPYHRRTAAQVQLQPDRNASLFDSKGGGAEVKTLWSLVQHLSPLFMSSARAVPAWSQLSQPAELPCTEARRMLAS